MTTDDMYEYAKGDAQTLPENLGEAIEEMKQSELVKKTLGKSFDTYLSLKEKEWDEFRLQVSAWELKTYMDV